MIDVDVTGFVHALADARLLEPEQYDEFANTMLPQCQELNVLSRELVYRGWLTRFQVEQIAAGKKDSLIFGSYVLLEPIGEGGMGRVYRARNWKLNRIVALKLIVEGQSGKPAVTARFQREIRALGRVRHPNIVMALDADIHQGSMYFAMQYFEGIDLGGYVEERGPLSVEESCKYILQAADALEHAHRLGLVHRDIKPSNLLLTKPDHSIKILDLGLTRCEIAVDDSVFDELTRAGAVIGTPDYMSPEQVTDSRSVDGRSDLYSLGCTWYYLLTGVAPFHSVPAVVDKLYAQCESDSPSIESLRPDIPRQIADVIRKLMAKRRHDRFQTPARLIEHLQSLLDTQFQPRQDTLIDAQSATLIEMNIGIPRRSCTQNSRTIALSHSQIEMIEAPLAAVNAKNSRAAKIGPTWQLVVAMLIATGALLAMWQTGIGPSSNRKVEASRQTVISDEPSDERSETRLPSTATASPPMETRHDVEAVHFNNQPVIDQPSSN